MTEPAFKVGDNIRGKVGFGKENFLYTFPLSNGVSAVYLLLVI